MSRIAVITGASSGIGAATALRLAKEGFDLVLGARRIDRLQEVADATGGRGLPLDVTDRDSIAEFAGAVDSADVLVNNAGLASGMGPLKEVDTDRVELMWRTNVLGLLWMTQAFLPKLEASGNGHIVNIGSTAALETYPGGGGYTASKHAMRAMTQTLRLELVGRPIRISEIDPGLVETEFSIVRFDGDREKAKRPYEGMTPLVADDIADCIAWVVTRPDNVNVDQLVVRPRSQATSTVVHREPKS